MGLALLAGQESVYWLRVPTNGTTEPDGLWEAGSLGPAPPGGTADLILGAKLGCGSPCATYREVRCIGVADGNLSHGRFLQELDKPRGSTCKSSEKGLLHVQPVLRNIPSGNTVRPCGTLWQLIATWYHIEARLNASPLGVVCWPGWYAEDVASVFPE